MVTNRVINGDDYRKVFLVGDIHGHVSKLMFNLEQLGFDDKQDLVVSVGDLVDRGPENQEAIELLTKSWFAAVEGNHEDMYVKAGWWMGDNFSVGQDRMLHLQNGGGWVKDFSPEWHRCAAEVIKDKMTDTITLHRGGLKIGVVHANFPHFYVEQWEDLFKPNDFFDSQDLIWNRSNWEATVAGFPLDTVKGVDFLVLGHSPVEHATLNENTLFIDTTVYRPQGYLTVIDVDNIGSYKNDS